MRRRVQGPTWCRSSTCPQAAQSNRGIVRHRRWDESPRCASWHTRARHCGRCVGRGCVGRGTCVGPTCDQTPRERSGGWRRSFGSAAVGLGLPWGRESAGLAAPCRLRSCAQAELKWSTSALCAHRSLHTDGVQKRGVCALNPIIQRTPAGEGDGRRPGPRARMKGIDLTRWDKSIACIRSRFQRLRAAYTLCMLS